MVLWIVIALFGSETPPPGLLLRISWRECPFRGPCAACAAASDDEYPFWNGERCVSCSVGTDRASPLFDKLHNTCGTACPDDAPWADDTRVCRECPEAKPYWSRSL